jgi:predicted DNA-binding protein YlxM (UPF0122 family)
LPWDDNALSKTTRINVLFDFYGSLLTEKQQTFMKCYFHDDYSLGEIAADFQISRQAVYEHLKRAELVLDEYESKLRLADRYERLSAGLDLLEAQIAGLPQEWRQSLVDIAAKLREADETFAAREEL